MTSSEPFPARVMVILRPVLTGIFGALVPVVPGPALVFAGLLLAAWIDNFQYLGTVMLVVFTVLTVIAHGLDFIAGLAGVKLTGAGRGAMVGATIGAFAGLLFGLPGILLGPFVGALIGELLSINDFYHATRAGIGAWFGVLAGMAAKLAISFIMVGWFLILRFW